MHAATRPHTAVRPLPALSQVWVFLFFPSFYFLENFTLKSTSLPVIYICFIIIEAQRVEREREDGQYKTERESGVCQYFYSLENVFT